MHQINQRELQSCQHLYLVQLLSHPKPSKQNIEKDSSMSSNVKLTYQFQVFVTIKQQSDPQFETSSERKKSFSDVATHTNDYEVSILDMKVVPAFSVYTEAALHSATRKDKRLDAIIVSDRKIPYYTEKKYDLNLLRNRNWGKSKRWQMRTWRKFPKQYPKRIKFWDWAKLRGTKKIPICYLCNWRSISIHVKYFNDTQNQSSQQTNLHSRLRIVCRSNSKPIKRLSENPIFDVKKRESIAKIIKKDKKKNQFERDNCIEAIWATVNGR